jgi:hypothetical protein
MDPSIDEIIFAPFLVGFNLEKRGPDGWNLDLKSSPDLKV